MVGLVLVVEFVGLGVKGFGVLDLCLGCGEMSGGGEGSMSMGSSESDWGACVVLDFVVWGVVTFFPLGEGLGSGVFSSSSSPASSVACWNALLGMTFPSTSHSKTSISSSSSSLSRSA